MIDRGVSAVDHYLDDYITMGTAGSGKCMANLSQIIVICKELGVPMVTDKLEEPSDCLTFLGIEIDTMSGQLRLPADKLACLKHMLRQWYNRWSCRHHELKSLFGSLHNACCVVKTGRAFLQRIMNLLCLPCTPRGHHYLQLNTDFRADPGSGTPLHLTASGHVPLPGRTRIHCHLQHLRHLGLRGLVRLQLVSSSSGP